MFVTPRPIQRFETLDSTSSEAKRQILAGLSGPAWIIADRQLGGYGRRARQWVHHDGDFAASLILPLENVAPSSKSKPPRSSLTDNPDLMNALGPLPFAMGLAVRDAIISFLEPLDAKNRSSDLLLKWPNDVLYQDNKLAGILIEIENTPTGMMAVIGVGINFVSLPRKVAYATACLADLGLTLHPTKFLNALDQAFFQWHAIQHAAGIAPIREVWLKHSAGLGETIIIQLPGSGDPTAPETHQIEGRFITIDDQGHLIVETSQGQQIVTAGDVFLGNSSSA